MDPVPQHLQLPTGNSEFCKPTIGTHVQLGKHPHDWLACAWCPRKRNRHLRCESMTVRATMCACLGISGHERHSFRRTFMNTCESKGSQGLEVPAAILLFQKRNTGPAKTSPWETPFALTRTTQPVPHANAASVLVKIGSHST